MLACVCVGVVGERVRPRGVGCLCQEKSSPRCVQVQPTFGSGNERGRCPPGGGLGSRSRSLSLAGCARTGPNASRLLSLPSSRRATSRLASHLRFYTDTSGSGLASTESLTLTQRIP